MTVAIAALLVGGLWWRHTADDRDPRAAAIRQHLVAQYSQQAWYVHITGVSVHDDSVYVHTDLPAWTDKTQPLDPSTRRITLAIYDPLWHYVQFDHREWHLGWVYILDRYGNYLDGGAG